MTDNIPSKEKLVSSGWQKIKYDHNDACIPGFTLQELRYYSTFPYLMEMCQSYDSMSIQITQTLANQSDVGD